MDKIYQIQHEHFINLVSIDNDRVCNFFNHLTNFLSASICIGFIILQQQHYFGCHSLILVACILIICCNLFLVSFKINKIVQRRFKYLDNYIIVIQNILKHIKIIKQTNSEDFVLNFANGLKK